MENIYNFTYEQLYEKLQQLQEKKYRCDQIYDWLYKKRVESFDQMNNLSKDLIAKLKSNFTMDHLKLSKHEIDKDVDKFLFQLSDEAYIESVLMHQHYGYSLCISSQVGCNMSCSFCESGRLKKVRNLSPSEMVLQIIEIEKIKNIKISHIVVMGIGEPFDNYDNLIDFINIINNPKALEIGSRHITVSTCGIIPKIKEFEKLNLQVNLAVSLHAPNDDLRSKLMPINKVYPLKELLKTLKEYTIKTGRRITFEYILLDGINDTEHHAKQLCTILKGINCYVNLIPYNESSNILYKRSKKSNILKFYDIIKKEDINVTIR